MLGAVALEAFAKLSDWDVVAFLEPDNVKLNERIGQISGVKIVHTETKAVLGQSLRNRFMGKKIKALAERFKAEGADVVLALQGDIERGSFGVLAASEAGIPCVSYIPNPHSLQMMKAKWGRLRDCFNRSLYNAPTRFIAVGESHRELLRAQGCKTPIDVVYNGIDFSEFQVRDEKLIEGLPGDKVIIGHIGRIEFNQKRQDFLVRNLPVLKDRVHLVIIGDGKDKPRLEALVKSMQLEEHVTLIPFMPSAEAYSSLDWLSLPSGYEGMPLVMCEALIAGVPVMSYDRDGMRDVLPEEWRFTDETYVETCSRLIASDPSEKMAEIQHYIQTEMTVEHFQQQMVKIISAEGR
jgi:glycosyltransferase involved in cell wall biosynthesis